MRFLRTKAAVLKSNGRKVKVRTSPDVEGALFTIVDHGKPCRPMQARSSKMNSINLLAEPAPQDGSETGSNHPTLNDLNNLDWKHNFCHSLLICIFPSVYSVFLLFFSLYCSLRLFPLYWGLVRNSPNRLDPSDTFNDPRSPARGNERTQQTGRILAVL